MIGMNASSEVLDPLDSEAQPAEGLEAVVARPSTLGLETDDVGSEAQSSVASALVKVAIPLRQEEIAELEQVLTRRFRRPLHLDIEIDPSVLGGVWVRVGDIVIDGSVRGKLETLRHYLRVQSRVISAANARYSHPGADQI